MLGQQLRRLREQAKMTQKDLAAKLFVSAQAVGKWERDEATPNPETLSKIADIFGVTADELLGRPKETPLVNGDPELTAYLEELRTRPEMRMLFDVTKDATLEDVQTAVKIIEALRGKPDVDT